MKKGFSLSDLTTFLSSRAEIHQIFSLVIRKIEDTKKDILRLTDLYVDLIDYGKNRKVNPISRPISFFMKKRFTFSK